MAGGDFAVAVDVGCACACARMDPPIHYSIVDMTDERFGLERGTRGIRDIGLTFWLFFGLNLMWAKPADASASIGAILVAGDNNESLSNLTLSHIII